MSNRWYATVRFWSENGDSEKEYIVDCDGNALDAATKLLRKLINQDGTKFGETRISMVTMRFGWDGPEIIE